jgi:hypothetical protein
MRQKKKPTSVPCRIYTVRQWATIITEGFVSVMIFLHKKLGRRRNVAPYKNCNQFFDVALIICAFVFKVNPCATFSKELFLLAQ